jgi:hypothetical protein
MWSVWFVSKYEKLRGVREKVRVFDDGEEKGGWRVLRVSLGKKLVWAVVVYMGCY